MNGNLFCKKMYANFNTLECHEIEIKSKDNRPPDSISRFLQAIFHLFIFRSPHRSWQYQPYRRAISPTLPRNMADVVR